MKYEYTCLNIYTGKYYTMKCDTYYKKGTILQDEYECKSCRVIKTNQFLYVY